MTRVGLCFPGQGSQAAGMADGLLDTPTAVDLLAVATGEGLDLRGALTGSDDQLRPTDIAQPALVFTELVLAAELPADLDVVGVAGHSVGEFSALSVAGVYSAGTAVRLVIARGRAMATMTEGTMAAVLGLEGSVVDALCREVSTAGEVAVVANLNSPGQVVISGSVAGVRRASEASRDAGARRVIPLKVSGAFHSPLMHGAALQFARLVDATATHEPRIPAVCNVDGQVVDHGVDVPGKLRRQMESPVRWVDCVTGLRDLGAEVLVEVGPGAVLTGMARRIVPELGTATVSTIAAARDLGRQLALA